MGLSTSWGILSWGAYMRDFTDVGPEEAHLIFGKPHQKTGMPRGTTRVIFILEDSQDLVLILTCFSPITVA